MGAERTVNHQNMTIALGEGEAEIYQEQENTIKQGKDPDPEKKNFKEIMDGDATKFECNQCRKKFKRAIGARSHIRSQHIKKRSLKKPGKGN